MPAPESRLLKALKRKFRSPAEALKALGLDAKLLDPPRRQLAYDGKRLGRDQDEFDEEALREFIDNLSADQCAAIVEMLDEKMEGMAPPDDEEETVEDEPPFENGGRPRPGGEVDPIKGYRPNVAQDRASFNKLFPSASRIGHSPFGSVTPAERAIINKARPRLAKDARPSSRRAPSFAAMFPDAVKIKQAL